MKVSTSTQKSFLLKIQEFQIFIYFERFHLHKLRPFSKKWSLLKGQERWKWQDSVSRLWRW